MQKLLLMPLVKLLTTQKLLLKKLLPKLKLLLKKWRKKRKKLPSNFGKKSIFRFFVEGGAAGRRPFRLPAACSSAALRPGL